MDINGECCFFDKGLMRNGFIILNRNSSLTRESLRRYFLIGVKEIVQQVMCRPLRECAGSDRIRLRWWASSAAARGNGAGGRPAAGRRMAPATLKPPACNLRGNYLPHYHLTGSFVHPGLNGLNGKLEWYSEAALTKGWLKVTQNWS